MKAKIIVLANEKGGTGKSTLAMHLAVALMRQGKKVATFDLDARQGTLSRYIQNRADFKKINGIPLPTTDHTPWTPDKSKIFSLAGQIEKIQDKYDAIIIDTPGAHSQLTIDAMVLADIVVTPINDSLVDLDVLALVDGETMKIKGPSQYAQTVWNARQQRMMEKRPQLKWVVVRNRLNHFKSRNRQIVDEILEQLSRRVHFNIANGVAERVVYRELFLKGLTMMDCKENGLNMPLSVSSIAARQEIRSLLNIILHGNASGDTLNDE